MLEGCAVKQTIVASAKGFDAGPDLVSANEMEYREIGSGQQLVPKRRLSGADEVVAAIARWGGNIWLVSLRQHAAINILLREAELDQEAPGKVLLIFDAEQPLPVALILRRG